MVVGDNLSDLLKGGKVLKRALRMEKGGLDLRETGKAYEILLVGKGGIYYFRGMWGDFFWDE